MRALTSASHVNKTHRWPMFRSRSDAATRRGAWNLESSGVPCRRFYRWTLHGLYLTDLPAYLVWTSEHSISNHLTAISLASVYHVTGFITVRAAAPTSGRIAGRPLGRQGTWCAVRGSRLASALPDRLGRIEFTKRLRTTLSPQVAAPPCLTTAQLPLSVTGR